MSVIAIYNMKGGVGKTTAAVNLSYLAAAGGERVLLWDLDPQAAATFAFRIRARVKGFGRKSLESGESLVEAIKVRRADVRRAVTALHREGLVDVRTMRLSMMGFALGTMYASQALPPLRRPKLAAVAAA